MNGYILGYLFGFMTGIVFVLALNWMVAYFGDGDDPDAHA